MHTLCTCHENVKLTPNVLSPVDSMSTYTLSKINGCINMKAPNKIKTKDCIDMKF